MKGALASDTARDFPAFRTTLSGTSAMCAAFAFLYALGMPGYDVPGLPFVCLVPLLFLSTTASTARQAARRGLFAGILANLLLFYWIAYTVAVPGNLGWILGGLAALFVSAYMAVYISLAAVFAHRFRARFGIAGLWLFPVAWAGLEYARTVLFSGFPWLLFGYTLSGHSLLRQAADLAGVYGLGFLLATANVCLYRAGARSALGQRGGILSNIGGAVAIAAFLLVYGTVGKTSAGPGILDATIRVGIVQGNIDQSIKWDPDNQKETLRIYRAMTREAGQDGSMVIVWPETAAPFFYGWEPELSAEVDASAAENGVPLIFGAPWFDPSEGGRYYNSVFLLGPDGVPRGRYDKRHLVPFGEYIPLRRLLFFLQKLTVGEVDFSTGKGPSVLSVLGTSVGPSVCYEAIFPAIVRASVREGATWLVNLTNDGWFGDTVAPRQHLAMARMRSVEFHRPLVRAANSGISAIIDGRGEVLAELGLLRRGVIVADIAPRKGKTVYAKTGDIFAISCTIMTISFLIIPGGRDHGRRSSGRESHLA